MKKIALVIVLVLFLTPIIMAETTIDQLNLKRIHGETVLRIDASGPVQFNHQIKEAEDGKPFRVIIDLFPAVHRLGQKSYADLPQSVVTALRTSQFSSNPEKVVRVVLDLRKSAVYRIEKSGNYIFVYIPDTDAADFPEWTSVQSKTSGSAPVLASSAKSASETKPDRKSFTATGSMAPTREAAVKSKPETEIKPSDVKAEIAPQSKPSTKTEIPSQPETKTMAVNPVISPATDPLANVAVSKDEPTEAVNPVPVNKYVRGEQSRFIEHEVAKVTAEPAPVAAPAPDLNSSVIATAAKEETKPAEVNPAPSDSAVVAVAPQKSGGTPLVSPSVNQKVVNTIAKPDQPQPEQPKPSVVINPNAAKEDKAKPEDIYFDSNMVAGGGSPDDLPAIETPADSAAGIKPTSRFRREPAFPNKLKGTIVAEFPQRMVIEYAPGRFRDPFETLIDDTRRTDGPRENRIPDVETSRLVGILESVNGDNRALLEDMDGYGYILKSGDKVKKGYVDRIDPDKAFFQLFEYGWSRTIALFLGHN